jgi:2,3-bisphosphoglycerate-independent phosphoglycerate mutase
MRVVLIFIDGLGLGHDDARVNPCLQDGLRLLACCEDGNGAVPTDDGGFLIPTEATLGVKGLPQSATGQTTLFTGINGSRLLGRHLQGYPNETLRSVLRDHSILKQVKDRDLRTAFINAYRPLFFQLKEKTQWRLSTTTVATLSAGLPFFRIDDIGRRRSIYHDFTNESLIARGFDVPRFSPEEAGHILSEASRDFDFLLYEYFMTDRAGHSQDMAKARWVLGGLERFLSAFLDDVDLAETLVVLTSDHGNIEDLSVKTHTRNRVMTRLWGWGAEGVKDRIHSLEDITPAILGIMAPNHREGRIEDDPAA